MILKWILQFFTERTHCSICGEVRYAPDFFKENSTCGECTHALKDIMKNKREADLIHRVETVWTPYNQSGV